MDEDTVDRKTVILCSFGRKWGWYPGTPGERTFQYIIDVRAIPDPRSVGGIKLSGMSSEVQNYVRQCATVWLDQQCMNVRLLARQLLASSAKETKIFFMCDGGYQRSPAVCELIAASVRPLLEDQLELEIEHLSMEHARKRISALTGGR